MINLQLNPQEAQALGALIDAGLRASGIQAAQAAAVLFDRLQKAVDAAAKAEQQTASSENVIPLPDKTPA